MKIDIGQLDYYDAKLKTLLSWIEEATGVEFTITSQWRKDDTGVHGTTPLRGTDCRCWLDEMGEAIERHVNANWTYDPDRPNLKCCMYHSNRGGAGNHLHFQVHPNTVRTQ